MSENIESLRQRDDCATPKERKTSPFSNIHRKGPLAKFEGIVGSEFVRMDYGEAIEVLERGNEKFRISGQVGHRPAVGARALSDRENAKKPVIVMNYPKDIKAFYMRVNDDDRTGAAMEFWRRGIGEIIGGSQREERLEVLDRNMAERGIDREHYAWYRDLRRTATASSMSATPSPSRAPAAPPSIDIHIADFGILGGNGACWHRI